MFISDLSIWEAKESKEIIPSHMFLIQTNYVFIFYQQIKIINKN